MLMQNLSISEPANERYMRAWKGFVTAIKAGEHISFSSYCKSLNVNLIGFRRWLYIKRLSVRELKENISAENRSIQQYVPKMERSEVLPSALFVPITPSVQIPEHCRPIDTSILTHKNPLRDIKLEFSTGISLSLKECSLDDLITLVTNCGSQGGL